MYKKGIRIILILSLIATPLVLLRSMFTPKIISQDESVMPKTSIYDYKAKLINGKEISLEKYKGKKILFVNVASKCGYTPQYKGLQELYEAHGDKIEILGFPCYDFGAQEPGTAKEIASFCSLNYGVSFPMMEKVHVKGNNIHPVYDWLTDKDLNGWNSTKPSWNFCKYLISEEGELLKFYRSGVKPMSSELTTDIIQPPLLKK